MKMPSSGIERKIAITTDFDGVISKVNVLNSLYQKFGRSDWQSYTKRWELGEIGTKTEIHKCLGNATATREEMELHLESIPMDMSIIDLYNYCQDRGYYFAIISDGFEWYIEYLLEKIGIFDLDIFANQIHFQGDEIFFSFPWYDPCTPLRGTSKVSIIEKIKEDFFRVLFLGDGHSDIEVLGVADSVLAKNFLLKYAKRMNILVTGFSDLGDALKLIKKELREIR